MSRDTLIQSIKNLINEWQNHVNNTAEVDDAEAQIWLDAIDDLKGILPPEDEP